MGMGFDNQSNYGGGGATGFGFDLGNSNDFMAGVGGATQYSMRPSHNNQNNSYSNNNNNFNNNNYQNMNNQHSNMNYGGGGGPISHFDDS